MTKIFCISDVHGCLDELVALVKTLQIEADFNFNKDKLVMLGDMIDRGPDSKGVIEWAMKMKKKYPHWVFLYGNHEDLIIDALLGKGYSHYNSYDLWWKQGGLRTAQSYLPADFAKYDIKTIAQHEPNHILSKHLEWIFNLPVYHEDENYFYVHGGVIPGENLVNLVELANPLLDGSETIVNAMLWARETFIDSDYDWGKFIVFGHTPNKRDLGMPIMMKNKCGIDGCVCPPGSKNLLALELPTKKIHGIKANSLEYFTIDYNINQ